MVGEGRRGRGGHGNRDLIPRLRFRTRCRRMPKQSTNTFQPRRYENSRQLMVSSDGLSPRRQGPAIGIYWQPERSIVAPLGRVQNNLRYGRVRVAVSAFLVDAVKNPFTEGAAFSEFKDSLAWVDSR
jgi:hypothetical protein